MKYIKLFENFKDVEIYKKYYSDIDYDVYNQILSIQPKKRIYKDWLLGLFRENKLKLEDLYKAEEYLSFYDRPNIKSKFGGEGFIKTVKDLPELFKLIEPFKSVEMSPKELKDKVYEDTFVKEFQNYKLYIPKTYEQSCKLGKGTEWCTATEKTRSHYDEYDNQGDLLIFVYKTNPTEKYQFHLESNQYMDKNDEDIDIKEFMSKNPDIKDYFLSFKNDNNLLSLYKLTKEETLIKEWIDKHQEIYNFVKNKISNLTEFKYEKYPSSIFYMNVMGDCIFEYVTNLSYLFIRKNGLCDILKIKYQLKYNDIKYLIEYVVNLIYNLNIKMSTTANVILFKEIDYEYKLKMKTTSK